MNRIDRLSAILIHLQGKKVVTAQELALRFSISIRTVYRDIRALEEAGVPIGAEAGVGYFLIDSYHLPPVMFTREEAGAFILAEKILNKYSDASISEKYASALYKIRSVLQAGDKEYLESIESRIDVLRPTVRPDGFPNNFIPTILDAIAENRVLEIEYFAAYCETTSQRKVEPVNLTHYSMHWHLIAWCRERNDYRDFRLDRIKQLRKLDEIFPKKENRSVEEYFERMVQSNSLTEARVRFHPSLLTIVAQTRYYFGFTKEEVVDGETEMTFFVNSLDYLANWLLSLGDKINIVSPNELSELMSERVEVLYSKHNK